MIIISVGVVQNSVSSYLIVMNERIEWNKSREEGYFLPPLNEPNGKTPWIHFTNRISSIKILLYTMIKTSYLEICNFNQDSFFYE